MKKKHFNIPVFIPELACPFQCIYCNQRRISGKHEAPAPDEINRWIEQNLKTIHWQEADVQLAFFGGNFTGLPPGEQEAFLEIAEPYVVANKITGIRISTRPDYISIENLDFLKHHHVHTIELGVQSMDDVVLKLSQRGYTSAAIEKAARMIRERGFDLGLQMMIGLPGDTFEKSLFTAKKIIELGAKETRIYPTLVIKGTKLEALFHQGQYKPLTLEEAVDWSAQLVPLFEEHGVKVLKVGLHPSEGLMNGAELIAGPFHPSFRELVLTKIWNAILHNIHIEPGKSVELEVPRKALNHAAGYEASNKKELLASFSKVKFKGVDGLSGRDCRVRVVK